VDVPGWPEFAEGLAQNAVHRAREKAGVPIIGPAELSLLLTNDARQRELNREWRDKDSSTNVLSFPNLPPFTPLSGLVGDISLARETVEREAGAQKKTFAAHFSHLVVHGFLHILGHDHIETNEAELMERLETDILAELGIEDPYADI